MAERTRQLGAFAQNNGYISYQDIDKFADMCHNTAETLNCLTKETIMASRKNNILECNYYIKEDAEDILPKIVISAPDIL